MSDPNEASIAPKEESRSNNMPESSAAVSCAVENSHHTNEGEFPDPLRYQLPSDVVKENDHVVLVFADGRQTFAQCVRRWKGRSVPLKLNKRTVPTSNLIGMSYGTVLELDKQWHLIPLSEEQDLLAADDYLKTEDESGSQDEEDDSDYFDPSSTSTTSRPFTAMEQPTDNRNLLDNNTSQGLKYDDLVDMREKMHGSEIIKVLIENSATFEGKTKFSKAKYIARKQMKYQIRCRLVRCTASSICQALYLKDPRKLMNMREDTLAQILSYSNVTAGSQVLLIESCMGLLTGAIAERMGGYGRVISVYNGQQPSFFDLLSKFNLTFAENHSIKWVRAQDVFACDAAHTDTSMATDREREERELMEWPCHLQDHTRAYLTNELTDPKKQEEFLLKRSQRFARKLTRYTPLEVREMLLQRPCDSVVIACRYEPTATILALLPLLAPSCPFVVFCEYLEPLTECFHKLQKERVALNLRLSDTWMREYQVLSGRTRPNMHMSQNGGFLLTGVKLCPETGHQDLCEELLKDIRAKMGPRRKRQSKMNGPRKSLEKSGKKRRKV